MQRNDARDGPPPLAPPEGVPLVPLASGGGRHCYLHPHDPGLCVKVPHAPRGVKESRREWRHLARIERRFGTAHTAQVARCLGPLETSAGIGWLVERVRDGDPTRRPSASLPEVLDGERFAAEPERWRAAFAELAAWLAGTAVVVRDLSVSNFCAQRLADGALRLVLVDGVGPKEWLPQWLPTRVHARHANRRAVARRSVHSIEALLEACERERAARRARPPPPAPPPVSLLGSRPSRQLPVSRQRSA